MDEEDDTIFQIQDQVQTLPIIDFDDSSTPFSWADSIDDEDQVQALDNKPAQIDSLPDTDVLRSDDQLHEPLQAVNMIKKSARYHNKLSQAPLFLKDDPNQTADRFHNYSCWSGMEEILDRVASDHVYASEPCDTMHPQTGYLRKGRKTDATVYLAEQREILKCAAANIYVEEPYNKPAQSSVQIDAPQSAPEPNPDPDLSDGKIYLYPESGLHEPVSGPPLMFSHQPFQSSLNVLHTADNSRIYRLPDSVGKIRMLNRVLQIKWHTGSSASVSGQVPESAAQKPLTLTPQEVPVTKGYFSMNEERIARVRRLTYAPDIVSIALASTKRLAANDSKSEDLSSSFRVGLKRMLGGG